MKKILIFSLMLASFLCSEAKERSLQQKLEIASEVLRERLPSVGGKTSRGGVGESLRVMRQSNAYTVVGRNRNGFVVLANDDAFAAYLWTQWIHIAKVSRFWTLVAAISGEPAQDNPAYAGSAGMSGARWRRCWLGHGVLPGACRIGDRD